LDDGLSGLVALSGETLSIAGEPLLRFRVANLGRSACVVPIKIQREVIGMLVVIRKDSRPFEKMEQMLLEAISDYASISLLNARLFRALNNQLNASKEGGNQHARWESMRSTIAEELHSATPPMDQLLAERLGSLTDAQRKALQTVHAGLQRLAGMIEKTAPSVPVAPKKK
jgi:signal transduction protein with GAF and PtsI domain